MTTTWNFFCLAFLGSLYAAVFLFLYLSYKSAVRQRQFYNV